MKTPVLGLRPLFEMSPLVRVLPDCLLVPLRYRSWSGYYGVLPDSLLVPLRHGSLFRYYGYYLTVNWCPCGTGPY